MYNKPLTDEQIKRIVSRERNKPAETHKSLFSDEEVRSTLSKAVRKGEREVLLDGKTFDIIYLPKRDAVWVKCRENNGFPAAWISKENL